MTLLKYSYTADWNYFPALATVAAFHLLLETEQAFGTAPVLHATARVAKLIDLCIVAVRCTLLAFLAWLIQITLVEPYYTDFAAYGEAVRTAVTADPLPIVAAFVYPLYGRLHLFNRLFRETILNVQACAAVADYFFLVFSFIALYLWYMFLSLPLITLACVLCVSNACGVALLHVHVRSSSLAESKVAKEEENAAKDVK